MIASDGIQFKKNEFIRLQHVSDCVLMRCYHRAIMGIDQDNMNAALIAEDFHAISMIGLINRQYPAFKMTLRDFDRFLFSDTGCWIIASRTRPSHRSLTYCSEHRHTNN